MSIPDAVLESLKALAPEDQQKVLDFIRTLPVSPVPPVVRKNPRGMFSDRGVRITEEDIKEVRREMWANFPREFPPSDES